MTVGTCQSRVLQNRQIDLRNKLVERPFIAQIFSLDKDKEIMSLDFAGGAQNMFVKHPFVGAGSWIRAMPSNGQTALVQFRGDAPGRLEILDYINQNIDATESPLVTGYKKKKNLWRTLNETEIDIASTKGYTTKYLSRFGINEDHAGMIYSSLDNKRLHNSNRAATYIRATHRYFPDKINGVEFFGVVKRPSLDMPFVNETYVKMPITGTPNSITKNTTGTRFATEYLRVQSTGDTFPDKLEDLRVGDVTEDIGIIAVASTGFPLRKREILYTTTGQQWKLEVDTSGNTIVTLPIEAVTKGFSLSSPSNISFNALRTFEAMATDATLFGIKSVCLDTVANNIHLDPTGISINAAMPITIKSASNIGISAPLTNITGSISLGSSIAPPQIVGTFLVATLVSSLNALASAMPTITTPKELSVAIATWATSLSAALPATLSTVVRSL